MSTGTRLLAGIATGFLLLIGVLIAGPLSDLVGDPGPSSDAANAQQPIFKSSVQLDPSAFASEDEERTLLETLATFDVERAEGIVRSAFPGISIIEYELTNVNGSVVYAFDLDTGAEVFVDAGNGDILAVAE